MRRVRMESLCWLVDLARRAGVQRLVVNGSFVTDRPEPEDVDCTLLTAGDFPRDAAVEAEFENGLPFIDMELADQKTFDIMVKEVYATDRHNVPKGMIEVIL